MQVFSTLAECNSAIQQIENLRYVTELMPSCTKLMGESSPVADGDDVALRAIEDDAVGNCGRGHAGFAHLIVRQYDEFGPGLYHPDGTLFTREIKFSGGRDG